jgi:Tol biopolymer transport system component
LQHADAESREIRYIPTAELGEGAQSSPYLGRTSRGASPRLSPNGRYLAFESHESGRVEVFVGSFPDGALMRRKISTRGGRSPRWSPNGKDLFYLQGDSLVAVSVQSASRGITLGSPQELFSSPDLSLGFAPSTDGQRFLTIEPVGEPLPPAVHVIENWHGGLNRPAAEAGIGW